MTLRLLGRLSGPKLAGAATWLAVLVVVAHSREARTRSWDEVAGGREAGKPVLAVIGLRQQKITVYDSAGPVLRAPVSTGSRTYETPAGIFTVLQKNKDHVSNLYEARRCHLCSGSPGRA
jgi:lipoprotein-anchoring transpeptidase ErfK/SrfK